MRFRTLFFVADFVFCWAAVFYKAKAAQSFPWEAFLIGTLIILGFLAFEVVTSSRFSEHLAPGVYGFLMGAGVNVVIQALLNKFQGINWTFQSPILSSLGTVLFGFLGAVIFITHGEQIKKNIPWTLFSNSPKQTKGHSRSFITILWIIAAAAALGLCINLYMILKIFNTSQTDNPLRKPLWFSAAAVILLFTLTALARKHAAPILFVLIPGLITGLIWASLARDMIEWVYIKHPEFALSSDILELLLILNFCYLGTAWLNRAFLSRKKIKKEDASK